MRNGWKGIRWATLMAFGALVSAPMMAAQGPPTAKQAQEFLAAQAMNVTTQVRFIDTAGRTNYVTGTYTGDVKTTKGGLRKTKETTVPLPERAVDKQLTDVHASALDAIDVHGRPNACATRISEVAAPNYDERKSDAANDSRAFSFTVTQTNEQWTYESLTKFTSPAEVIDWSNNVKVSRDSQGYVTVTSRGQAFPTVQLTYLSGDPNLADQIEFAMKFLAMSCDASAASRL